MRRISLFIVINAISLYIVSVLMKSVYIGSLASLITLTIIFGLLNLIVKPVIEFFSTYNIFNIRLIFICSKWPCIKISI